MPGVDDPAHGGPSHHGGLLLLAGADVVDDVLAVLPVHVHLEGEHDHGDGEAGQRDDEHAAQGVQSDPCNGVPLYARFTQIFRIRRKISL